MRVSLRHDFSRLKRSVSIRTVLAHYGLHDHLQEHGAECIGPCPLPGHRGDRSNRRAFRVHSTKGVWLCQTHCGGGDLIRLVAILERGDHAAAARTLARLEDSPDAIAEALPRSSDAAVPAPRPFQPYRRTLRLDPAHPFLARRAIDVRTARLFEAGGWPLGGFLRGCVGVRLHDPGGQPLGYAGRRLDPADIARYGTWKLPSGFPKAHVLFNWHRARFHAHRGLILVEGPWDAMRVHQAGYPNVVALLGLTLSRPQLALLHGIEPLVLMLDGDPAGRSAAPRLKDTLPSRAHVLSLPTGHDPADLSDHQIQDALPPLL